MLRIALLLTLVVALLALQPIRAEDVKPAAAAAAAASAEKGKSPLGRKVGEFTLKDHSGKAVSLADFKDRKLVVVAFLGVECPLAKLYAPRLKKLADEFEPKGVGFLAIDANCQDSVTEIAAYARRHELAFPILKDLGNRVADQMGAQRTPEVFLLDGGHDGGHDGGDRVVRYWGRIDDQYGIGFLRDQAKRQDLRVAVEELLAGKPISVAKTESSGCRIGRVQQPKADAKVTYANQISRIFQQRCVECHRQGEIGPFALTSYDEVVGWAETIAEVVRDERMPPWHADPKHGKFLNDRRLTSEEKKLIAQWVDDGAPSGDLKQVPKPRRFTTGWQLAREPDAVVYMRERPYDVPSTGAVRYQYFIADPGFKEDKWIKVAEVLPDNRAVVHHVLVFASEGDLRRVAGGAGGFLVGYVPGLRPLPFPDGMAKRVPAGSKLVFQVHYTPNGSPQKDRTKVGFIFADPKDVKQEVMTISAASRALSIPPLADNHRVEATGRGQSADVLLLGLMPHMHVRGKSFFYEAVYPDGQRETILDVPHYDFNWQTSYRLAEPKPLPAGTRMHCIAHYDNSENNPSNPNPKATVRWGDQTWNEMMIGYFDIAVPRTPKSRAADMAASDVADAGGARVPLEAPPLGTAPATPPRGGRLAFSPAEILKQFDRDGDGKVTRDEVPERLRRLFDRLDRDGDKVLSPEELQQGMELLPRQ
jgi:peroxiredoxin/mono/diheme cytochrome c family protein